MRGFVVALIVIGLAGCDRTAGESSDSASEKWGGQLDLARAGRLTQIVADKAPIHDADLADLAGLDALEELTIDDARITDAGLIHLAKLGGLKRLVINSTQPNHVDVGDQGLAALSLLTSLERLYVPCRRATSAGLSHAAKLDNLVILNLHETAARDDGLTHLSALPKLELLNISSPHFTEKGMAAIAKITTLRFVNLYDTPVTDAGLDHLAALKKLESLYFDNETHVTDAGLSRLKRALPNLHLHGEGDRHIAGDHDHP